MRGQRKYWWLLGGSGVWFVVYVLLHIAGVSHDFTEPFGTSSLLLITVIMVLDGKKRQKVKEVN